MDPNLIINSKENELLIELLRCKICLLVALNPVQCRQCESVFCKDCISSWKKSSNTCPLRCPNFQLNEEARLAKNLQSKLLYLCSKCNNRVYLGDYHTHITNCSPDLINCPTECGELLPASFKDTHLKFFCPNSDVQCPTCSSIVKRKSIILESCKDSSGIIKSLTMELKLKDEIIAQLKIRDKPYLMKNINESSSRSQDINQIPQENSMEIVTTGIESQISSLDASSYRDLLAANVEVCKSFQKLEVKSIVHASNSSFVQISHADHFTDGIEDFLVLIITSGDVILFSITSNSVKKCTKLHSDNITDMRKFICNYEEFFITSSFDSTLKLTNPFSLTIVHSTKVDAPPTCLLLASDVIFFGNMKGEVCIALVDQFEIFLRNKIHRSRVMCIEFTDNTHEHVLTFGKEKTLCLLDSGTLNIVKSIDTISESVTSIIRSEALNRTFVVDEQSTIFLFSESEVNMLKKLFSANVKAKNELFYFSVKGEHLLVTFCLYKGLTFYLLSKDKDDPQKIQRVMNMNVIDISAFQIIEIKEGGENIVPYGMICRKDGRMSMFKLI